MIKKILCLMMTLLIGAMIGGCVENSQKNNETSKNRLVIYTSMKESIVGGILEGFKKKYPDIEIDYQSAGAGKIMAKLSAERQSGHIMADVIWTSEVPDFYQMRNEGLLEKYQPAEFNHLLNPFDDYDGSFTAARLGTLGIVINTSKVSTPPTTWEEIATNPAYKDSFGMALFSV